jgi:epoxyqueuosine reductase
MELNLVKHILAQHGVSHSGVTPLSKPLSLDVYKNWIAEQMHGEMHYLQTHCEAKESPQSLLPSARSAIVFTVPYKHPESELESFPLQHLQVAKYAQGKDYHFWLQGLVNRICVDLKKLFNNDEFLGFTDSSPVMERDLAYRAGLGWFGKNSCIISRAKGSYFLIAEIYTSMAISSNAPMTPDHCGTCNRCVEACPTQAINDNRTLDARKCISYWTIESKTIPPKDLRSKFEGWFFGCDICQDVCPWNGKLKDLLPPVSLPNGSKELTDELRWILTSSNNELERQFTGTPLVRARGRGLKRNALIVIAHKKLNALLPEVTEYVSHKDLGELAQWTLQELSP